MKKNRNSTIWKKSVLLSLVVTLIAATLCIYGVSATDITPEDPFPVTETLTGIEIASMPTKTVYDIGEAFSVDGLTLRLKYNSGRTETIAADATMCTGFDSSTAGEKTIAVSHRGFGVSFKVDVRRVVSVSVESTPRKAEYFVGEDLDLDGLKLKITYSAGPAETRDSGYTLVGATRLDTEGTATVTVECAGQQVTFTVTVKKAVPASAKLTALPTKTDYMIGEKFDGTGAAFTVTYTDGTTKVVTEGITFSGFSSSAKGEKTVTATWGDFTDKFTVNVKYAAHVHVAGGDRVIIKEATCAETGKAVRYCKICGEVAESATLKKLEHIYSAWTVDKAPTESAAGERHRACTVCGTPQIVVMPALSSTISDGKNGSVTAAGGYLFPAMSSLRVNNISQSITAAQLKALEDIAKASERSVAAVFNVTFVYESGDSFTPNAKLTYKLILPAASLREFSNLKVIYDGKTADASYSAGYVTFTVTGVSGTFAIAGVRATTPSTTEEETTPPSPVTTKPEVTTAPVTTPGTSSGETTDPPVPPVTEPTTGVDTDPAVTPGPGDVTTPATPEVTTAAPDDDAKSGVGGAVKTIIIVIVAIVIIGALFELLYIYLKNKLML